MHWIHCSAAPAASALLQKIRRLAYALASLLRHHVGAEQTDWRGASHPPKTIAMDAKHFDSLTRSLLAAGSRRAALRLLGAPALGRILALLSGLSLTTLLAREVRAQECSPDGTRCGRATDPECCSGWCKRKRGSRKKFCRAAPGQGICTVEDNICGTGDTRTTTCNATGSATCFCYVTSRGFSFCGQADAIVCVNCTSDADCVNRPGGQAGDRCVPANPPRCCPDVSGQLCVHECPNPATT